MQISIQHKPAEKTIAGKLIESYKEGLSLEKAGCHLARSPIESLRDQCIELRKSAKYFPYKDEFTFADNSCLVIFIENLENPKIHVAEKRA